MVKRLYRKERFTSLQFTDRANNNKRVVAHLLMGGVVAYPVMQVCVSIALEDDLEVSELVWTRCSISCVCTSAFKLPAKETHNGFFSGDLADSLRLVQFLEQTILKRAQWLINLGIPALI